MNLGFYIIMAAQFFSSLADNALLVAAIALLMQADTPTWLTPYLKFFFVVSYVALAPYVGAFADRLPLSGYRGAMLYASISALLTGVYGPWRIGGCRSSTRWRSSCRSPRRQRRCS